MHSGEKKWVVDSIPWPQLQKAIPRNCLNLCSLKWLKPRWSRVISLIPLGLWQLYTELAVGLIKWRIFFLNVRRLSELRRLGSNSFHSAIADGKNFFFEEIMFWFKNEEFVHNPCFVWSTSNRNQMEKVLRMLVFKCL